MEIAERVDRIFLEMFGEDYHAKFVAAETCFAEHKDGRLRPFTAEGVMLDSLDRIEFFMAIEDEFGFDVSDEIAMTLHTRQNVIDLVEKSCSTTCAAG